MMKRNWMHRLGAFAAAAALVLSLAGCGASQSGGPADVEPVQLTVWTYYNGDQLESFNRLVEEFNATVGKEQNITVENCSQGNVNDLEAQVMASAQGKVGAEEMPNIFMAYADTAYTMDQMGELVDLAPYFTDEERAAYIGSYLTEGDFNDDGKALFGRDAMANYMLIGAKELGDTLFDVKGGRMTVELTEATARRLWDNYYVPYVKGWFSASGRFRSDDIKIGNILAYVGSSSSATYFPSRVMLSDTESHSIALKVLPAPHFADGEKFAVQQGAGMAVAKTTDAEEAASVVFLKWLTQPENNIAFAVGSGYLPVTHAANEMDAIRSSGLILTGNMENILMQAVDTVNSSEMYTPRAFEGGTKARNTLTYSMSDLAEADRATVVARIAAGESAADAEAEFMTDEYFEAWYQSLCDALRQYEG